MKSGIESYGRHLNPEVVTEIKSWAPHPQLSKLLEKLQSVNDPQQFLDHYAEAMVARYLLTRGCKLEVEVPTTRARTADFCVSKNRRIFYVHVKRLNLDKLNEREVKLQNRLWELRKIRRPIILLAHFWRTPTDAGVQRIYKRLKKFVQTAGIGETLSLDDADFTIALEHTGHCVQPVLMGSVKHVDDRKRFYKKLSEAYKQFVLGALNVILVTSLWSHDIEDLETALFGTTFEVLDGIPPNLRVIQSGRKPDGFWSAAKHPESYVAGCFNFGTKDDYINFRMWYRDNYKVSASLLELFGRPTS